MNVANKIQQMPLHRNCDIVANTTKCHEDVKRFVTLGWRRYFLIISFRHLFYERRTVTLGWRRYVLIISFRHLFYERRTVTLGWRRYVLIISFRNLFYERRTVTLGWRRYVQNNVFSSFVL